jgi:hypothetical protein
MTKKDFEAIAAILRTIPQQDVRDDVARGFATYFETRNPRFLRSRFLSACNSTETAG